VTIAGQSAGGGSVWALMISPPAAGLFHAAISHSGALSPQSAAVAQDNGRAMAELAGVEWSRAGLSQVDEEKIIDLQDRVALAEPPTNLDAAVGGIFSTGGMQLAYLPYLDGQVLPGTVEESLEAGVAAGLPLIMGAVAHEFTAAAPTFAPLLAGGDLRAALAATPLAPVADDYLAAYAGLPGGEASALGQLITDLTFRVPMVDWANRRRDAPTWLYDFRLVHPDTGLSAHCAELPFAWDCLEAPQVASSCHPDPPQSLADAMHGAWVEFIRNHRAPWPAWSAEGVAMVFDTESEAGPAFDLERRIAQVLRLRDVDATIANR
jgi:para-nitrobenzyl esterase